MFRPRSSSPFTWFELTRLQQTNNHRVCKTPSWYKTLTSPWDITNINNYLSYQVPSPADLKTSAIIFQSPFEQFQPPTTVSRLPRTWAATWSPSLFTPIFGQIKIL